MKSLMEINSNLYGSSISFIDIDETTFHTYAKVGVYNRDGKLIRKLDNQQFNTYDLQDGEHFNFDEFRDSKVFNKTSEPIEPIVNKIQNMVNSIKRNGLNDKVIFLTARSDFNDKELFLKTFRANGIDVDDASVYIERSGNLTDIKSVADRKKFVMLKYLKTGEYTRVRMIDDDINNLRVFKELGQEINSGKYNVKIAVRKRYPRCNRMSFFPLLVDKDGKIRNVKLSESVLMERIFPELSDLIYGKCLSITVGYGKKPNAITKWLCQQISNDKRNAEEIFPGGYTSMTKDYIDLYKKYNNANLIKDISNFKSFDELKNEIIKIKNSGYKSNSEREENARNSVKFLLNNEHLKIMEINSWEAAKKYGKGTKWCTSSEINDAYFKHYSSGNDHLLYVFYNDKKYGVSVRVYDDVYTDGKKYYYCGDDKINKNYEHTAEIDIEIFDEKDNILYSPDRMNLGNIIGEKVFDKTFLEKGIMYKNFPKELFLIIYETILKTYVPYLYEKFKEKNI